MKGLQKIQKQMAGNQDLPIAHDFGILPALYPQHTYCRHKGWYLLLHVNTQIAKGTWQQNQQQIFSSRVIWNQNISWSFTRTRKEKRLFFDWPPGSSTTKVKETVSNCIMPILSPFVEQTIAWFPKISIVSLLQATQTCSFSKTGIPSHLFIEIDHSRLGSLFLRNGRAHIQAPAWGATQQRIMALF